MGREEIGNANEHASTLSLFPFSPELDLFEIQAYGYGQQVDSGYIHFGFCRNYCRVTIAGSIGCTPIPGRKWTLLLFAICETHLVRR